MVKVCGVAEQKGRSTVKVLIAGGAGYIGSTIGSACLDAGITPIIVDNFVTGRREFTAGRLLYEGGIEDRQVIDRVFEEHPDIFAVVHCAALISVPDSVADPVSYYQDNVANSLDFVSHLVRNGCSRLIFSSSASIYRTGGLLTIDETADLDPQSPYARTKAMCESMFQDIAAATTLRILSLRYFNPIGADPQMRTGLQLPHPSHALGKMIEAMESGAPFEITGTDYDTRDGTGVRDYVHVWDLVGAHLSSLQEFDTIVTDAQNYEVINLGTGRGTTVRELLEAFNEVVSVPIGSVEAPRRPGDVAGACASNDKAKRLLGWEPRYSLVDGIRDSLRWSEVRHSVLGA
jgi:UDP-glucose 4-epimerase